MEKDNKWEGEDPGSWDKSRAFCCVLIKRQNIFPKNVLPLPGNKTAVHHCFLQVSCAVFYFSAHSQQRYFDNEPSCRSFDTKSVFRKTSNGPRFLSMTCWSSYHEAIYHAATDTEWPRESQQPQGRKRWILGGGHHVRQQAKLEHRANTNVSTSYFTVVL